jgi:hypothetical protein
MWLDSAYSIAIGFGGVYSKDRTDLVISAWSSR